MKPFALIFYILPLLLLPAAAAAQVVVNHAALDQLAGFSPPPPDVAVPDETPPPRPVRHHHRRIIAVVARPVPEATIAKPVAPPAPPKAPAPVPAGARLAPPLAPKPTAPLAPVTIKFTAGSADLPPGAAAAIKPFCTSTRQVAIDARAPGDASDPSIAMRLSLARAQVIRDALAACGVPGPQILPRAVGNVPGQDEDAAIIGGTTGK